MTAAIPSMSPLELSNRLEQPEGLALFDVRESNERAYCAIRAPETVFDLHVPMNTVPERVDELRESLENIQTVVYCHHGVRSAMVAQWLLAQGFSGIINLEGGIDAWSLFVDSKTPRY